MCNYCKHHQTLGGRFSTGTIVTEITIPPSCGDRFLPFAVKTIMENGGKIWDNPTPRRIKNYNPQLTTALN